MQFFGPEEVATALPWPALIEAIENTLVADGAQVPDRTVHQVPTGVGRPEASLLLKPGWIVGDIIAVKAVTFVPDNGVRDLPTVNAGVLLFSGADGTLIGACDGNELTTRRTAAASAVAAKRLARTDARTLLVVGTGALAPMAVQAHLAVRPYEVIEVWGRSLAKSQAVVDGLADDVNVPSNTTVRISEDLDRSVANADVICGVTGATAPIIKGALLQAGSHVDLIGSFTPQMRESDDDVVRRASIFVDSRTDGVLAGDLAQPLADGLMTEADVQADLFELISGEHPGRTNESEITMYKSAGIALEDVAAARLVFGA